MLEAGACRQCGSVAPLAAIGGGDRDCSSTGMVGNCLQGPGGRRIVGWAGAWRATAAVVVLVLVVAAAASLGSEKLEWECCGARQAHSGLRWGGSCRWCTAGAGSRGGTGSTRRSPPFSPAESGGALLLLVPGPGVSGNIVLFLTKFRG